MLFIINIFNDVSLPYQIGFQNSATPVMEGIIHFHNDLMYFLIVVVVFVFWILYRCIYFYNSEKNKKVNNFTHGTLLEIVWTTVPALILFCIAFPSFSLLYAMDETVDPLLTLKIIGHQWYWSYEYSDYFLKTKESFKFDSYLVPENELDKGQFRLLEVDNRIVLPIRIHTRLLITSADVLHSWAVPSLGIKLDACPGRLNQTSLFLKREGVFYGQCSEICGVNHGFMPIVIESVTLPTYINWLDEKTNFLSCK